MTNYSSYRNALRGGRLDHRAPFGTRRQGTRRVAQQPRVVGIGAGALRLSGRRRAPAQYRRALVAGASAEAAGRWSRTKRGTAVAPAVAQISA